MLATKMSYTLFIDESGESGISHVRTDTTPGASPYMTLGAVLISDDNRENLTSVLSEITANFGKKSLHCNKLNHRQKIYYSKKMSEQEIVCFGLISCKATLRDYSARIDQENTKYFNKCAMYILECVGEFMKVNSISSDELTVVFEEGHHDYAKFRSLMGTCQSTPFHPRAHLLQQIALNKIVDASKAKEPLLTIADLVAHALYQAVNKSEDNYQLTEIRYLKELHKRFFCSPKTKKICPTGLKPIHSLSKIGLDRESQAIISQLEGEMKLPRQT